jgi:hypothetical protein
MAVLAKMVVQKKVEHFGTELPPEHFTEDHWFEPDGSGSIRQDCDCRENAPSRIGNTTIVMTPVYSREKGHENHLFWDASPSGSFEMNVANKAAADYFETGQEYYVEIRKARK